MAVYTDGIHLVADSEDELHFFAKQIGLKKSWFQDNRHKHYPLIGNKVNMAILAGAQVKESRFLVGLKIAADLRNRMSIILG